LQLARRRPCLNRRAPSRQASPAFAPPLSVRSRWPAPRCRTAAARRRSAFGRRSENSGRQTIWCACFPRCGHGRFAPGLLCGSGRRGSLIDTSACFRAEPSGGGFGRELEVPPPLADGRREERLSASYQTVRGAALNNANVQAGQAVNRPSKISVGLIGGRRKRLLQRESGATISGSPADGASARPSGIPKRRIGARQCRRFASSALPSGGGLQDICLGSLTIWYLKKEKCRRRCLCVVSGVLLDAV